MIDHILVYAIAAARDAAWPAPRDMEGNTTNVPAWTDAYGRNIMPARIVLDRAVFGLEGELISPEVVAPGAWLVVRTMDRDPEIEAMTEAVIVTDAVRAVAGDFYVIKCTLGPETVLGQVDPVWAGSEYAIPVGEPASALDAWRIAA